MPKPPTPESFEVTEYGTKYRPQDRFGLIYQIIEQMQRESPVYGCRASFSGNLLRITYNCYESMLPTRMRQVEDQAKQVLNSCISLLKKEYRRLSGKVLTLNEQKNLANYTVQKVSLNERYIFSSWRFYELGDEE